MVKSCCHQDHRGYGQIPGESHRFHEHHQTQKTMSRFKSKYCRCVMVVSNLRFVARVSTILLLHRLICPCTTRFFFIRTSKFWPSFVILKFLHYCSFFYHVNYILWHCYKSFSLVFKNTCGTVLIFFSAYSVFLTAEKPTRNPTRCVVTLNKKLPITFASEAEPQLFLACS